MTFYLNFSKGSIGCNFTLLLNQAVSNELPLVESIKNVQLDNITVDGVSLRIEKSKTNCAIQKALSSKQMEDNCRHSNVCSIDRVCVIKRQRFMCEHKCDVHNMCSNDGECYVNEKGDMKCRCREDSTYIYKGEACKEKVLIFFSGKNTAIIGACAGAVVAFLLLLVIYLGARWRRKRNKQLNDEKMTNPEEIQRENSRIENVPMAGVGKTNPTYRSYKDELNHEGNDDDNHGGHLVYEDTLAYDEGRYYRVLNDPENRSKAFVYQPSNMSMPDTRTSTASKFDDLDSQPPSFHMRPEIEQRQYQDIVTAQPYSIKRPQIMYDMGHSKGQVFISLT
ncbi:interphotoreceptor matrix proteoglycan 2-like [Ylistrum balloti]|uniref:interphotoreceptor matrix proteoglycan 2-like n=1 Tax=Ylistrum balloti TaxID=509963 RepID=UPI002905C188|nr:interphotoreceptor matrix proteoglycan 2-like [Ylistrum balloti]